MLQYSLHSGALQHKDTHNMVFVKFGFVDDVLIIVIREIGGIMHSPFHYSVTLNSNVNLDSVFSLFIKELSNFIASKSKEKFQLTLKNLGELSPNDIQFEFDPTDKEIANSKIENYISFKSLIVDSLVKPNYKPTKIWLQKQLESKVLDRVDEIFNISKEVADRISKYRKGDLRTNTDKDQFPIFVYGGATGIGKSRLLLELKELYKLDKFNHILPVLISFSSNTPYTPAESDYDMEKVVLSRCAYSLGIFDGVDGLLGAYESDRLQFSFVFRDPPECILLLIDEFNYLPDERLEEFVSYCGSLLIPDTNKPLIIIVTAGTNPGRLNEIFTKSRCPSKFFPISSLKMATMIKDLNIQDNLTLKEMYRVLQDICGIPRLYSVMKRMSKLPDTYEEGISTILSEANICTAGMVPIHKLKKVVAFSLLEYPVNAKDQNWDEYTEAGHAFLYPGHQNKHIIKFPMYWISNTSHYFAQLQPQQKKLIQRLYWSESEELNRIDFVELGVMWIAFKTYLFCDIKGEIGGSISLSNYIGVSLLKDENINLNSHIDLFQAQSKVTDIGFENLKLFGSESIVRIEKSKPFIVACLNNQDGIDCVELLFNDLSEVILIFYQFRLHNSPTHAKKNIESSKFIRNVKNWYESRYQKVDKFLYVAICNYCNSATHQSAFAPLVKEGMKFCTVQGSDCRAFMSSILCERQNIWTGSDKLFINVAPSAALKMLPNIDEETAATIVEIRVEENGIKSFDHLKEQFKLRKKPLLENTCKSLKKYIIW
eukprot:NODE_141_length_15967_cov_0.946118.p3 type:complete len:769 gc:universal NODE_141_length_15967_cov_0.946118:2816-5122(+)